MSTVRIVYFGTSPFALPSLARLLAKPDHFKVVAVVTQPDRPAGRHGDLNQTPVARFARDHGLMLLQPNSLKDADIKETLTALHPDLFVVAAYGVIIPQTILDIPHHGSLNLHGSLLPKYRGASPIHSAIVAQEKETGITLMQMDARMDHGPILDTVTVPISQNETTDTLEQKLAEVAAEVLERDIVPYISGALRPIVQDHDQATFTKLITKESGRVDWSIHDATTIDAMHRAFITWPGIWTEFVHHDTRRRLKIVQCERTSEAHGSPGTVTVDSNGYPLVATKRGSIRLLNVQPEGKKVMDGKDFLRGYQVQKFG